ncbi:hypothetical protein Hdeb2414_s0001g00038621 [Helianthus debilis subsp. tardiflorus]
MFMSSFTLKFKISHYVKFICPLIFSFLACKCLCFCRTGFLFFMLSQLPFVL